MPVNENYISSDIMPLLLDKNGMAGTVSPSGGTAFAPWLAKAPVTVETVTEYTVNTAAAGADEDLIVRTAVPKSCCHIYVDSLSGGAAETGNGTKNAPFTNLASVFTAEMGCLGRRLHCVGAAIYVHITGTVDYLTTPADVSWISYAPGSLILDFEGAEVPGSSAYRHQIFSTGIGAVVRNLTTDLYDGQLFNGGVRGQENCRCTGEYGYVADVSGYADNCRTSGGRPRLTSGGMLRNCNFAGGFRSAGYNYVDGCSFSERMYGFLDSIFHRCTVTVSSPAGTNICSYLVDGWSGNVRCSFSHCTAVNAFVDPSPEYYRGVNFCGFRGNTDCTFYNCTGNNSCTEYSGSDKEQQEECQKYFPCSGQECDV